MKRIDSSSSHPVATYPDRDPAATEMETAEGRSCSSPEAALRSLFHSPKYNFQDGLDDYCLRDPECGIGRG